jgi:hypothetical protein
MQSFSNFDRRQFKIIYFYSFIQFTHDFIKQSCSFPSQSCCSVFGEAFIINHHIRMFKCGIPVVFYQYMYVRLQKL